jgi:alkylhydroperoxidase family enzyme
VAALHLADAMSGAPDALSDALVAELRSGFDEAELAELILVCGQANLNNRAGNAAKRLLGPDEPRPEVDR